MVLQQDILDNMSTGVICLDDELCVTAINASAQALMEASAARVVGQDAAQLCLNPDELLDTLRQVRDARTPVTQRGMSMHLPSSHTIHLDLFVTPILQAGEVDSLLVELQPVDRLQRISREEGMQQAQETTRAVIRGLAHEIKNPLGGVRGAAQLLAKELPDDSLTEYTRIIIREADRLRDLVDRLLGPHHQLQLAEVNIHEILEHVRNLINAEAGGKVTLRRDYDPSLPDLPGDRVQLIQVVLNIMRNALQAAESPSDCEICLRTRSRRQFTIGSIRHRLVCRIDITDNGPGIPEELQQSIFVPMVTGRADGTGLGLSIAQSIISRHGGLLECRSEPGCTRFTIYLPMEQQNDRTS
ncbi:nitrogen regulation protein NR(II) [Parahaliea maris]|uniref:Sensory histidine kinase/phosphatase NtrB n=1 Tax=Parahaliea maris TaxID=2716870 RepID=A0A5C8ZZF7_9GAMM|nr:nitrogen regulation protein NR(II) [Parahaliea maris]TXS93868.1 nitrogen regulation protein NR(II) [Parahaliea maris]